MTSARSIRDRARAASLRAARSATSRASLPWWITGAGAVALVGVVVGVGGFDTVSNDAEAVDTGTAITTSLYAVTITGGELTDAVEEEYLEADEGETLLVLDLTIENLSDAPVGVGTAVDRVASRLVNARAALLVIPEANDTYSARAWRPDGSSGEVVLQPGVPSEIRVAWTVPSDAFTEGRAELDVYDAVEQGGQIILSSSSVTWQRREQVARVIVDLESR